MKTCTRMMMNTTLTALCLVGLSVGLVGCDDGMEGSDDGVVTSALEADRLHGVDQAATKPWSGDVTVDPEERVTAASEGLALAWLVLSDQSMGALGAVDVDRAETAATELETTLFELQVPAPATVVSTGWANFELVESTCGENINGWWLYPWLTQIEQTGAAVDIYMPMFPVLSGTLQDASAELEGAQGWMNPDGVTVSCVVDGVLHVDGGGEMHGEVSEVLTFDSGWSCESTVAFSYFDPEG